MLLGHRYYDPNAGRFLTRDPEKDGRNWYVYCDNNPLKNIDPSGFEIPPAKTIRAGNRLVIGVRAFNAAQDPESYQSEHPGLTAAYMSHGHIHPGSPLWTNCATFASVAVGDSDTDFPEENTGNQSTYLANSNKWRALGDKEASKPGDIAVYPPYYDDHGVSHVGHIMVRAQDRYRKGKNLKSEWTAASLGDHGPTYTGTPGNRFTRYRIKE